MEGLLSAWGRLMYRNRWLVISFWILLLIPSGWYAMQLPEILKGSGFEIEGEFQDTVKLMEERFDILGTSLLVVFERDATLTEKRFTEEIAIVLDKLSQQQHLIKLDSPLDRVDQIADDHAYGVMSFALEWEEMNQAIDASRQILTTYRQGPHATEGFSVMLTGAALIDSDLNIASQKGLLQAEKIGVPIALLILVFAFGTIVAAAVPVMVGIFSVVAAMGTLYFVGMQFELSIFLLNIVVMIGLALGIDFALLFVSRFREELARRKETLQRRSIAEAVEVSVMTAGESIIFSGVCVIIGLSGMMIINIGIFQAIALGGMAVVFFSVFAALTFLPALLGVLGERVNRLRLFKPRDRKVSAWLSFSKFVMGRPRVMALLATVILILMVLPVRDIDLQIPGADALPADYEARVAFETYETIFVDPDRALLPIVVSFDESALSGDAFYYAIEELVTELEQDPLVYRVDSIFSALKMDAQMLLAVMQNEEQSVLIEPVLQGMIRDRDVLLQVFLTVDTNDRKALNWVRDAGIRYEGEARELSVGGYAKFQQEIFDEILSKVGYGLLVVFGSTYLILLIAYRSVVIPLKAIIVNALSLSASFGILVFIFQSGWFLWDPVSIALFIPIFIFGIVFGLSMDYEVFLISRIYEVYRETGDNVKATLEGLASTSKIISSAAAILIVITGAFAFVDIMPVVQMGIGTALAIFIDATIVRMVLVPSVMKLMGRWNWWAPGRLGKRNREIYEKYNQVNQFQYP